GRILKFETTGYASSLIATFTIDGAAQAGSNPAIVSYGLFGGTSMILDLGFTSSTTKPQFQFKNAGGSYVTLLGTVNLAAGLHTMCCTSDGVNTITLWADGVLITSNAAAGAPFAATSSNVMLIGAENYNTITGRLFRGSLGNVMAFNRALSASDIQRLSTAPVTGLR
ncbi:MAG: hypothetical protein KGL35_00440, partial [Bradyrhizobium sp.]|nr:hypothetical protein [Bradyrhizobium sp.]